MIGLSSLDNLFLEYFNGKLEFNHNVFVIESPKCNCSLQIGASTDLNNKHEITGVFFSARKRNNEASHHLFLLLCVSITEDLQDHLGFSLFMWQRY